MYRYWSGGEKSLSPLLMTKPSMENHEHWYGVNDLGLVAAFTWPEYVDDKPVPYSLKELGKRTASDVHRVFQGRLDRFIAMAEARGLNYDDICRGTDTLMQTSSGLPLGVDLDTVNHLSDFAGIIYDSPSVIGKRRYPHLDRLQSDIAIDWTKTAAAVTLGEIHWGASQMLLHMGLIRRAFQRALPSPPPPDSKYYPLFERLDTDDSQTVTLTLDEVGRLLALPDRRVTIRGKRIGRPEQDGGLPESAYTRRNWWANRVVRQVPANAAVASLASRGLHHRERSTRRGIAQRRVPTDGAPRPLADRPESTQILDSRAARRARPGGCLHSRSSSLKVSCGSPGDSRPAGVLTHEGHGL